MTETNEKTTQVATETKVFTFNPTNQSIQVEMFNHEPWFVAADVCNALNIGNVTDAVRRLDEDEKLTSIVSRAGQNREVNMVNESGLYNLIFQSRKPEAKAFRKWVTSEVLPSIRKTGRYELRKKPNAAKPRARRGELINADLLNLLWLIGESLQHGDQKQIALELGVSVQAVSNTLNGMQRSPRILKALYHRAMERREEFMIYYRPDLMADRLLCSDRTRIGSQLPTVHIDGCKGLMGNQNASKAKKGGAR